MKTDMDATLSEAQAGAAAAPATPATAYLVNGTAPTPPSPAEEERQRKERVEKVLERAKLAKVSESLGRSRADDEVATRSSFASKLFIPAWLCLVLSDLCRS